MSSNNIENKNKNIKTYCVSVMVQGVQCPAERRGKQCHMAHTSDEVNPRKCNRGSEGEECRCKHRTYPFVCQFIHEETKEEYSKRVGFDPNHEKYNDYSLVEIKKEMDKCGEVVDELKEKISKFDLNKIPEKDKAYVRRTQNSIHHLSLKIKWLRSIEQNDKYYLSRKDKAENREIVRRLFKEGKYVTVDRSFESEDDAAEYEEYYDEKMADLYEEIEYEYGTRLGAGFDTCEAELLIMKDWIRMAIDKWDEEEEEAKKKTIMDTNIDEKKESESQSSHAVSKTTVDNKERKVKKNVWSECEGGSHIIHTEKKRELEERFVVVSKAEHERLHKVVVPNEKTVKECYRKMDDDMRRENKARINGLEERTKAIQSGWGDVIKGMVNQNGAYSDEEEFLKEKKWEAENREIQEYHAEMDRLYVENGYFETHEDDNGDMYFRTPEEKAKNREKVRAKFKKGKYIRVEDVFEDENDEACFEEYREMMEQDYMDDMEGSYADMQLAIVNDWVDQTIERWDREDNNGEKFEDLHLKDAWGDYRDFDRQKAAWEDRHDKWEEQYRERDDSE